MSTIFNIHFDFDYLLLPIAVFVFFLLIYIDLDLKHFENFDFLGVFLPGPHCKEATLNFLKLRSKVDQSFILVGVSGSTMKVILFPKLSLKLKWVVFCEKYRVAGKNGGFSKHQLSPVYIVNWLFENFHHKVISIYHFLLEVFGDFASFWLEVFGDFASFWYWFFFAWNSLAG